MKTVIHVWTHEFNINQKHLKKYNYFNETEFYFGLGDLIRSTIKLYELSKSMKFHLIVDIQLHPISHFLELQTSKYSDLVKQNKNNIDYVCYGGLEDYINNNNNKILYILTNDFFEGIVSNDCKKFIKNILIPSKEYKKYIDFQLSKIHFSNYNIFHFRLNDNEIKNNSNNNINININYTIYDELIKKINENKENNDILITDTLTFKDYVFFYTDIFLFETKICHLGLSKDYDSIRDTLFEFFLITNSKKIKTYCKIHKISGFVKWISQVYDIPITIID